MTRKRRQRTQIYQLHRAKKKLLLCKANPSHSSSNQKLSNSANSMERSSIEKKLSSKNTESSVVLGKGNVLVRNRKQSTSSNSEKMLVSSNTKLSHLSNDPKGLSLNKKENSTPSLEDVVLFANIERIRAIRRKDRTADEQREFCRLLMQRKRREQSMDQRKESNIKDKERMKSKRKAMSEEQRQVSNMKDKVRMKQNVSYVCSILS